MAAGNGKTGKVVSVVLTPDQLTRRDRILEATGLNWNQFARLCVDKLTPSDVEQLKAR